MGWDLAARNDGLAEEYVWSSGRRGWVGEWPAVWSMSECTVKPESRLKGEKLVSHIPERYCQLNKRGATTDPTGVNSSLDV